jgi:hypothetical protein
MGDEAATGRRILVISDETLAAPALHQAIRFRAQKVAGEVLVVADRPRRGEHLAPTPTSTAS